LYQNLPQNPRPLMLILGIETSCDETGVALYDLPEAGVRPPAAGTLLAHAVHSQTAMHEAYGGVVPELASRDHVRRLVPLSRQVLERAGRGIMDIGAIAYTEGPGLAGALLAGAAFARSLALALEVPAIGIHHLEGHLLSPLLSARAPRFPFIALLVSGGHTQLMRVTEVGRYELLGETLDDAAGEAFDKTAQLLGLGYPGGPALASLAQSGNAKRFDFPRPMIASGDLDFSFSGLKTAVLTRVRALGPLDDILRADLAASFQEAIVDVLAAKCIAALEREALQRLVVAGGVGANNLLRVRLQKRAADLGARVFFPPPRLCTDNGAMIAFAAALKYPEGRPGDSEFAIHPRWDLSEAARGTQSTLRR